MVDEEILKSKQFFTVRPHMMEGHLLLSLSQEWIEKLDGVPIFDVFIDRNGKLALISQQKMKR